MLDSNTVAIGDRVWLFLGDAGYGVEDARGGSLACCARRIPEGMGVAAAVLHNGDPVYPLQRTPRGRLATRLAYEHLGLPPKGPPPTAQVALWDNS